MTKERIHEYSVRISQSSREQLVAITCEIAAEYMRDSLAAYEEGRRQDFSFSIKKAMAFVDDLASGLDMQYAIAGNLLSLYMYIKRRLIHANAVFTDEGIADALQIMDSLREAFDYAAGQSEQPEKVIEGSEQIYAGYTYGRNSKLNEYVVRNL